MTKTLTIPERTTQAGTPASRNRRLYPKSDGWYDLNDAGEENRIISQVLIQRTVLSSSSSGITFANIPQIYRHLLLRHSARTDHTSLDTAVLHFNNDTGNNYDFIQHANNNGTHSLSIIYGYDSALLGAAVPNTGTANHFGITEIMIFEYSNGSIRKSCQCKTFASTVAGTTLYVFERATIWLNTAAITEIDAIALAGSNLLAGTMIELWGIL